MLEQGGGQEKRCGEVVRKIGLFTRKSLEEEGRLQKGERGRLAPGSEGGSVVPWGRKGERAGFKRSGGAGSNPSRKHRKKNQQERRIERAVRRRGTGRQRTIT